MSDENGRVHATSTSDDPPGLTIPTVDNDASYVLGYPVQVAISVCSDPPDVWMRRLPLPSWAGNVGAIGVRLTRADTGEVVVRTEPNPIVIPELGTPVFVLKPGECRRMLIDISSFLPAGLDPVRYQLAIAYVAPSDRAESPEAPIELTAPSPAQQEELEHLKPSLRRAGSWGRWTSLPPGDGEQVTSHIEPSDPLRFNRVLRYLMYGPDALDDVDPALIDVLRGVYEPEAHALRAELYAARGDAVHFAEQAEIVRTRYPGLAWWIDRIEAGRSEFAFVRWCRARPGRCT